MNKENLKKFIENRTDLKYLKHASNILTKINNWGELKSDQQTALLIIGNKYVDFLIQNDKAQDFAIYRPISLKIEDGSSTETNLPIVSIENKTYIDKTMLEGAVATAEKIKFGNPYSLYYIVTENYDVDLQVDPIYSRIDQIYVLRKSKRKGVLQPIDANVVYGLVNDIKEHLERDWSNVEKKMKETGKIL